MTASIATNTNYFRIEGYIIICVIYLILVLFFSGILKLLSNKLSFPDEVNFLGFRKGRMTKCLERFHIGKRQKNLTQGLGGNENE